MTMVKFGDLKVSDKFRYSNNTFYKTLVVDMKTCVYNAATDWIGEVFRWQYQKIVYLSDSQIVRKLEE